MESTLPSAKILITNLFELPKFHKCALPYSVIANDDLIVLPVEAPNIGVDKAAAISKYLTSENGEEKVF